jgi:hypothetical protein
MEKKGLVLTGACVFDACYCLTIVVLGVVGMVGAVAVVLVLLVLMAVLLPSKSLVVLVVAFPASSRGSLGTSLCTNQHSHWGRCRRVVGVVLSPLLPVPVLLALVPRALVQASYLVEGTRGWGLIRRVGWSRHCVEALPRVH